MNTGKSGENRSECSKTSRQFSEMGESDLDMIEKSRTFVGCYEM